MNVVDGGVVDSGGEDVVPNEVVDSYGVAMEVVVSDVVGNEVDVVVVEEVDPVVGECVIVVVVGGNGVAVVERDGVEEIVEYFVVVVGCDVVAVVVDWYGVVLMLVVGREISVAEDSVVVVL